MNPLEINFSKKTYDVLKWIALVLLPAFAVLYTAMSATWPGTLPYPQEVVKTIATVDAFLGVLLGVSSAQYNARMPKSLPVQTEGLVISDQVYNALKFVAQILLPATATLYFGLATTWGLPNPQQVVTSIMAADAFLGMLLDFNNTKLQTA